MLVEEFYKINIQKLKLRIEVPGLVAFVFGGCLNPPSGAGFQERPTLVPSFGPIVILAAANNVDGRQALEERIYPPKSLHGLVRDAPAPSFASSIYPIRSPLSPPHHPSIMSAL